MSRLPIEDDCEVASDVFAKAKAVMDRRRAMFGVLRPPPQVTRTRCPRPSVSEEVARQLGIDIAALKLRAGMPFIQYRQFAMALTLRLTEKSLSEAGEQFGMDHSTAFYARKKMAPIIEAIELTSDNFVMEWVAAGLPLLFAYIEQIRIKRREHAAEIGLGKADE